MKTAIADFVVLCDGCRRRHGTGSRVGMIRDHRALYAFDGLFFEPWERAPGPVRAANPDAIGDMSGEWVAVGLELRARCKRRHRINCARDEVLRLMAGAVRVRSNIIHL